MPIDASYLGQTLALVAALLWAFAVILFKKSGEKVHPLALNLFKNTIAAVLLIPTMLIFKETIIRPAPPNHYFRFIISGLLGMAIGDTLFFISLNRIGASLSAIVSYMYSPLVIILSLIFLKETLTPFQITGIILIIAGLIATTQIKLPPHLTRKSLIIGIFLGILSNLATAIGIIIIKPILAITPLLWATQIRLTAGIIGLASVIIILPAQQAIITSLFSLKSLSYAIGATILGTYLALVIWLGGMKFTQVSIATPLSQTSGIFIFLLAALFLKEPLTLRKIIAVIITFTGALLIFLG